MKVGRLVPAGLLARGSSACSSLPAVPFASGWCSGISGAGSSLTVAGAASAFRFENLSPCSLFTHGCLVCIYGNRHAGKQAEPGAESQQVNIETEEFVEARGTGAMFN